MPWDDTPPTAEELAQIRGEKAWHDTPPTEAEMIRIKAMTSPRTVEKPVLQSQFEAAKDFGSYTAGSIPVLGLLTRKAAHATADILSPAEQTKIPYRGKYEQLENENMLSRDKYQEEHPTWAMGGALLGGSMIPGGKQFEVAKKAPLLKRAGIGTANLASRVGAPAATVAADTMFEGGDAEGAFSTAGGIGLGLEAALATARLGKYVPRLVTGVKGETAQKYKTRAPEINAANEEDIANELVATQRRIVSDPVDEAKLALEDAKASAGRAEMIESQKLLSVKPPETLPAEVAESMKSARKAVSAASTEGFNALKNKDVPINIQPWKDKLETKMSDMGMGFGSSSVSVDELKKLVPPSQRASFDEMVVWKKYFDEFPGGTVTPEQAKKIIRGLDAAEEAAYAKAAQPGGYISQQDRALMELRREISDELKQIFPDYAAAMEKASSQQKILENSQKLLGKDERAVSQKLTNLDPYQRKALEDIHPESKQKMSEYDKAKSMLSDKQKLQEHFDSLVEKRNLTAAKSDLESKREWLEPVKHLGNISGAQSALRRVTSEVRPDLKNKEALKYLGELSGENFIQKSDDLGVQRAMNQGFTRGSRNVNLGGMSLSGAFGTAANLVGGDATSARGVGAGLGAILGAASDLVGPQVYKKWLDFSMTPGFKKYADILTRAAENGPKAVAVTHYLLNKDDADYRRLMGGE